MSRIFSPKMEKFSLLLSFLLLLSGHGNCGVVTKRSEAVEKDPGGGQARNGRLPVGFETASSVQPAYPEQQLPEGYDGENLFGAGGADDGNSMENHAGFTLELDPKSQDLTFHHKSSGKRGQPEKEFVAHIVQMALAGERHPVLVLQPKVGRKSDSGFPEEMTGEEDDAEVKSGNGGREGIKNLLPNFSVHMPLQSNSQFQIPRLRFTMPVMFLPGLVFSQTENAKTNTHEVHVSLPEPGEEYKYLPASHIRTEIRHEVKTDETNKKLKDREDESSSSSSSSSSSEEEEEQVEEINHDKDDVHGSESVSHSVDNAVPQDSENPGINLQDVVKPDASQDAIQILPHNGHGLERKPEGSEGETRPLEQPNQMGIAPVSLPNIPDVNASIALLPLPLFPVEDNDKTNANTASNMDYSNPIASSSNAEPVDQSVTSGSVKPNEIVSNVVAESFIASAVEAAVLQVSEAVQAGQGGDKIPEVFVPESRTLIPPEVKYFHGSDAAELKTGPQNGDSVLQTVPVVPQVPPAAATVISGATSGSISAVVPALAIPVKQAAPAPPSVATVPAVPTVPVAPPVPDVNAVPGGGTVPGLGSVPTMPNFPFPPKPQAFYSSPDATVLTDSILQTVPAVPQVPPAAATVISEATSGSISAVVPAPTVPVKQAAPAPPPVATVPAVPTVPVVPPVPDVNAVPGGGTVPGLGSVPTMPNFPFPPKPQAFYSSPDATVLTSTSSIKGTSSTSSLSVLSAAAGTSPSGSYAMSAAFSAPPAPPTVPAAPAVPDVASVPGQGTVPGLGSVPALPNFPYSPTVSQGIPGGSTPEEVLSQFSSQLLTILGQTNINGTGQYIIVMNDTRPVVLQLSERQTQVQNIDLTAINKELQAISSNHALQKTKTASPASPQVQPVNAVHQLSELNGQNITLNPTQQFVIDTIEANHITNLSQLVNQFTSNLLQTVIQGSPGSGVGSYVILMNNSTPTLNQIGDQHLIPEQKLSATPPALKTKLPEEAEEAEVPSAVQPPVQSLPGNSNQKPHVTISGPGNSYYNPASPMYPLRPLEPYPITMSNPLTNQWMSHLSSHEAMMNQFFKTRKPIPDTSSPKFQPIKKQVTEPKPEIIGGDKICGMPHNGLCGATCIKLGFLQGECAPTETSSCVCTLEHTQLYGFNLEYLPEIREGLNLMPMGLCQPSGCTLNCQQAGFLTGFCENSCICGKTHVY